MMQKCITEQFYETDLNFRTNLQGPNSTCKLAKCEFERTKNCSVIAVTSNCILHS